MADINPSLTELTQRTLEVRDIQRETSEAMNAQKDALEKMVGLQRAFKLGLIERMTRERELGKEVKNIEQQLQRQRQITAKQTDDAKREESKLVEEGLAQRLSSYSKELEMLQKINGTAIGPMLFLIAETVKLFRDLDRAGTQFRKTMGFVRDTNKDIQATAQMLNIDLMHLGVTIDGVYNSFTALTKDMGSAHAVSQELVKTTSLLKAQLGISEDVTSGFLRNMAAISKSTMEAQQSMAYMAGALSNAAGVPLGEVMKDVASRSSTTLTMMSRIPSQIIRSAVELRKMGTDLERAAKSSRDILNFTENVNAEMEASVLLGHSINLQHARELAYRRDLEGSTKEILRLTKSINFENLDVFQQEAFAKATGKSVDELMAMVQAEKQWDAARKSADPAMRARVAAYEQLRSSNAAIQKDSARQLEMMVLQKSNQERIAAITQKWQSILAHAGEALLPIIDGILAITPPLMTAAEWAVKLGATAWTIGKGFQVVGLYLASWTERFAKVSGFFLKMGSFGEKILGIFGRVVSPFAKIGGFLGSWAPLAFKFVSPFLKLLGPIGWIITAFQAISGFVRGFKEGGLLGGLKGAFTSIIPFGDKILGFFGKIISFFSEWFKPGSPSKIGWWLVKGIMNTQAMIFDALTYPWRHFLAWIADKIPGMGKVAEKLRGGFGGVVNSVESKVTGQQVQPTQIAEKPAQVVPQAQAPAQAQTAEAQVATQDNGKLLASILESINTLNKNLESGKIGFYVDGQLLSATIARQTEFRGGYGVNKV
jgi:hypothetical protein